MEILNKKITISSKKLSLARYGQGYEDINKDFSRPPDSKPNSYRQQKIKTKFREQNSASHMTTAAPHLFGTQNNKQSILSQY